MNDLEKNRKSQQINKRYKEESSGNFRIKNHNNQNKTKQKNKKTSLHGLNSRDDRQKRKESVNLKTEQ